MYPRQMPTLVETPLPPLNFRKTGKQCPTNAAAPTASHAAYSSGVRSSAGT